MLGGDPVGGTAGDVLERRRARRAARGGLRSSSTWGTSTSQVATSALSTVASRRPPSASLMSGTERWASSPISSWRGPHELVQRRAAAPARRAASWASIVVRSRRVRFGSPARWRDVEQAERDLEVGVGGADHLRHRAHGVVELGAGVPQRVPDLLAPPTGRRRPRRRPGRRRGRSTAPARERP